MTLPFDSLYMGPPRSPETNQTAEDLCATVDQIRLFLNKVMIERDEAWTAIETEREQSAEYEAELRDELKAVMAERDDLLTLLTERLEQKDKDGFVTCCEADPTVTDKEGRWRKCGLCWVCRANACINTLDIRGTKIALPGISAVVEDRTKGEGNKQ